jgi:hypothetical protein
MLAISVSWHDVSEGLRTNQQPVVIMERAMVTSADRPAGWKETTQRARIGTYWVPVSSVHEAYIEWRMTKQGDYVQVPLVAYKTQIRSAVALFGAGIEIGMRAMHAIQQQTSSPIEEVHLCLGHTHYDLYPEDGFRACVGVSIRVADEH